MKDSNQEELSNKFHSLKNRITQLEKDLADNRLQLEKSKFMMQILDSATDSVFLHDFEGNFLYVNKAAYKTLGYTKKELMEMNLHDLDVPKFEKLIDPRIKDLMEKGESFFETAHFRKDGSQLPVEIHSRIIEYNDKALVLSYARDITERKKVENELTSSKEQYRTLFDNIGVGLSFISPKMEILDLNDQMRKWFPNVDVSKKPICYEAFNVPPRGDICTYCPTYKTLKDGEVHESVTDTPMGDEIINYRIVSSPVKDEDGNVVAAIEMVEDITSRKKMEDELERAYATFNSIFEGPENIIAFSLDRNYQYIFFNQAHSQTMKNIWGVDIEIGKSMLDYISYPEDREKAKINFDRVLSGEKFIELEDYGEEPLSRRYWENIYNPIQSGNEIIGLTVFCIDITERQKAEESLRQSEEKFRAVAESATDAIITADSEGFISFFNPSLLKLFGYTPSELRGKSLSTLIPEEYKNNHINGMKSFKSGKLRRTGKTSMAVGLKKDGTRFPCEMSISAWKSGEDTFFTSIIRDLTERKKAEDAIIRANEEWERTFDAVPDLIAILDTNYHVIRANKAMADRLGVSPEEAVGVTCYEVVHGLSAPPSFCPHCKLIEDGQEHIAEVHEMRIGGDFIVSVSPLYDSEGKIMGSVHVARDITDRKKAEEALRESEEKYRAIFENVQDVFFQTDIKGNIIELSPSVEKYFGIDSKELIGNHVDMLYSNPEDRKKLLKILQEKGEVSDYEIELTNRDNQLVYISANVHFIFDSKNRPVGIEGALRDITERKMAEKQIKENENKLKILFEYAPDPYFIINFEGKILDGNKAVEEFIGYSKEEFINKTVYELNLINEEDSIRIDGAMAQLAQGKVLEPMEWGLRKKDGTIISAETSAYPIEIKGQKMVLIMGRDITERKKAENALKLGRMRLSNAMDLANLANWELDPYKGIFIFNDRFYSMLGTTAANEGGYEMPIEDYIKKYVHPEDAESIAKRMKSSLTARKPLFGEEFEHRVIRTDGEIRHMAIRIKMIPATEDLGDQVHGTIQDIPDSKIPSIKDSRVYVYGSVQDVTERKIVEEKLKESLEEKEMLLKEIHHRVKNNLMVISSLLNLQSRYIKDKEALDIFKESQNRAKSMALIHERLYQSTDLKKIDFGDYIHTLSIDLFHTYVPDPSRVKLCMDVENVLVDINTTVPLGLIVNELVTNSMKHAFPEGKEGEIKIEFHKKDDLFTLVVSDNGVGFPEGLDFRRTDTLGLQLVNNLVSQIDGEITLDKSHGTKLKISFKEVEYQKGT